MLISDVLWKDLSSKLRLSETWKGKIFVCKKDTFLKFYYNEEFDPGSGWTLATGLTHASRGVTDEELALIADDRRTGE